MTHAEKELRNQKIVELRKQGYSQAQIAEMFNLSDVSAICKRYGVAGVMSDRKADPANIKYNNGWTKESQEEYAKKVIERKLNGFVYFGNYTGSSGSADIQCKECGYVFTQPFTTIRQSKKVWCRNCAKIANDKAKEAARNKRIIEAQKRNSEKDLELFLRTYQVECVECGRIFTTHNTRVRCCSSECRKKRANKRKDKRIARDKRVDKNITAKHLYKRDDGICWICGRKCDLNDYITKDNVIICGDYYPSVDHVVPVCDGGEDSWDNVRLAHRICNTKRYYKNVAPLGGVGMPKSP